MSDGKCHYFMKNPLLSSHLHALHYVEDNLDTGTHDIIQEKQTKDVTQ